jgi:hypothetical protein
MPDKKEPAKPVYPATIYVAHENPGTPDAFYQAVADPTDLACLGAPVEAAEYRLVRVLRITAHVLAKPKRKR